MTSKMKNNSPVTEFHSSVYIQSNFYIIIFTSWYKLFVIAKHFDLQQETILNHSGGPVHPGHPWHVELKVHICQYLEWPPVHKQTIREIKIKCPYA
jgi:hypothetical protein